MVRFKRFRFWTAMVVFMLILVGCGQSQAPSGGAQAPSGSQAGSQPASGPVTVNVALPGDINTLDPHGSELIVWTVVRNQIYDALVTKDPQTLEMVPRLATSWKWENSTTLEVSLRSDVVFHNGEKLTGADIKFSLERYRDKAAYGGRIMVLDRVDVVNDTTVKLVLKQPHAGLLDALGQIGVIQADKTDDYYKSTAVGTGPFKLAEWQPGNQVKLEKNTQYWRPDAPKSDFLVFKVMPQLETRIASLQAGDLDIIFDVDLKELNRLRSDQNLKVDVTSVGDFIYSIYVNTTKPYLADPKVRQALAYALNREAFIRTFQGGLAIPTNSALAPNHWAYDSSLNGKYPYDLKKAADLLAEAGFPGGAGLSLTLVYPAGYADLKAGSEVMHAGLTQLGIKAELREMELGAWYTAVSVEKTYDIGWDLRRNAQDDPAVQYGTTGGFQPGPSNRTGLLWESVPTLSEALRAGEATQEHAQRLNIYKEVQQIWSEQLHIIPVAVKPMSYAYRSTISGITQHPASHYQDFSTVTKGK